MKKYLLAQLSLLLLFSANAQENWHRNVPSPFVRNFRLNEKQTWLENFHQQSSRVAGEILPGQIIVFLAPDQKVTDLSADLQLLGFYTVASPRCLSRSWNAWLLRFDEQSDMNSLLSKTRGRSGVLIAQFNHTIQQRNTVPNDTQFPNMWDMVNTGQNGGTPDADIDADEAWDLTTGGLTSTGDTIVVAVVDGGFDLNHVDLNFWKNYAETNNSNGVDDDANGYIDDRNGWNAYNSNGNISSDQHGTHVSGTVGATGNNNLGVTGVNWGVKVMPVMGSSGNESEVVEAYSYVFDARKLYNTSNGMAGAFVVATNSSFGVDAGQPANYPIWCAMYDSLGNVGVLNACATANQNWNIDNVGDIPTSCASPYMIAVTNTTRYDVKYTNAGYGATTIDIGAPGTTIYSTIPNNQYAGQGWTGTSMATPHVAGAIGLMYAAACPQLISDYKNNPAQVALTMRGYLLNGIDTLSSLNNLCNTSGRLNLNKALQQVQLYNCTTLVVPSSQPFLLQPLYPNPAAGYCEIIYDAPGVYEVNIQIFNTLGQPVLLTKKSTNGGRNSQKLVLGDLAGGVYFVQVAAGSAVSNVQRLVIQ